MLFDVVAVLAVVVALVLVGVMYLLVLRWL
jgi:hypothetical protein